MNQTSEEHNAATPGQIDVGHAVMIISVDDDGNAFVEVVRGRLNDGYDAYYEFPDVANIKEVIFEHAP